MEEVQYECRKGYHFEQEYSKGRKDFRIERDLSSICEFGKWNKQIPERCYPDGCILSILAGSRYFIYENNKNNEIFERDLIPHGTNVSTECTTGYDMVKMKDGSLADVLIPTVFCSLGSWKNIHNCIQRCAAIHSSILTDSSDASVTLEFRHGDKVKIKCITGEIEVTCEYGTWKGYDEIKCQNNMYSTNHSAYTDGCLPPVDVPTIIVPKEVYTAGEIIKSDQFVCPKNYVLMPRNGMICSTGGWTETVKCIPNIRYVIQIQTGSDANAGTRDNVYVNLHGEKYSTGPLNVPGSYDKNSLAENIIWSVDVTPIKNITVSKDTSYNDWQVNYVSIFVEKDDHYYVFDANNNWITDQAGTEIELSHYPEHCVHTFQQMNYLYPSTEHYDNSFNLGRGSNISLRACKQLCVLFKEKQCNGVYLYKHAVVNDCWGFVDTSSRFFIRTNNANMYRRSCLK